MQGLFSYKFATVFGNGNGQRIVTHYRTGIIDDKIKDKIKASKCSNSFLEISCKSYLIKITCIQPQIRKYFSNLIFHCVSIIVNDANSTYTII